MTGSRPRVLAVDWGAKRVGLAISDELRLLATPLTTLRGASFVELSQQIHEVTREHQVGQVIVGLPISVSGAVGPQAKHVMRVAERLSTVLEVPVQLWNEQFSTLEAEALSVVRRGRRRRREAGIDAIAAAVILQRYLDAHR